MKRFLIALAAALLLVGCGGGAEPVTADTTSAETEAATTAPAPTGVVLLENGICPYTVVRPEKADEETITAAANIYKALMARAENQPELTTDWIKRGAEYDSSAFEILVGTTGHPEAAAALERLEYNEYGLVQVGNKLCVVGKSLECLQLAAEKLVNVIENQTAGGNLTVGEEYLQPSHKGAWDFTLPRFADATFAGTFDCNDDVCKVFFRDVSESAFGAYMKVLEADGAKVTKEWKLGENQFRTADWGEWELLIAFYLAAGEVGITLAEAIPEQPAVDAGSYTPVEPLLTQLAQPNLDWDGDMGYLLRLEDSSFIVVDGGYNGGASREAELLWQTMQAQNLRPDGKIIIRAWVITHGHNDHYNVLRAFAEGYGGRVTVESLLYNPMAQLYQSISDTPGGWNVKGAAASFTGCDYVKIMAGHVFAYPGCEMEVLYTSDDAYLLESMEKMNDSSTVVRLTVAGQTFLVLGDIEAQGAARISALWGDYLRSDIMQVAHHGYYGGSNALYDCIQPKIVLWPASAAAFGRWTTGIAVNVHLMAMDSVKEVINSGAGQATLALPYAGK